MEVGLDLYFRVLCCTEHERNDLFSILGTLINLDVETEKKEYKKRKWVGGGCHKRCHVCVIDMNHL